MPDAVSILKTLLANTSEPSVLKQIIAPDATYVSLNYSNPDLTKVMPWAGTHPRAGPDAIIQTFHDVGRYWEALEFDTGDVFGDATRAASFGRFTYRSRRLQRTVTSPFACYIRVDGDGGLVTYCQFMEDTLATTASFRRSGTWLVESDPDGGSVEI